MAHRTRKENTYMAHDDAESPPPRRDAVNACATHKWHMQDPDYRSGQGGTCPIQRACGHDVASLGGEAGQGGEAPLTSSCLVCQTLARSWERVPLCDVGLQVGASGRSLEPVSRPVRRCARSGYRGTPQSHTSSSVSTWSLPYRQHGGMRHTSRDRRAIWRISGQFTPFSGHCA